MDNSSQETQIIDFQSEWNRNPNEENYPKDISSGPGSDSGSIPDTNRTRSRYQSELSSSKRQQPESDVDSSSASATATVKTTNGTSTPPPISRDRALEELRKLLLSSFNLDISHLCTPEEQNSASLSADPLSRWLLLSPFRPELASTPKAKPLIPPRVTQTQIATNGRDFDLDVDLHPNHFIVYCEHELQTEFSSTLFYLQPSEEENNLMPIPPVDENFAVRVIDPVGKYCKVELRAERHSDRISCSFISMSPGIYTAEVRLRGKGHVAGSPLKITISRNYGQGHTCSKDILVYKNLEEIGDGAQNRPALQRSAWGLAYNPVNDELYIADRKFSEITTRCLNGKEEFKFGGRAKSVSGSVEYLCVPTGLAFDSVWNRIIVVERGNHRVLFFTPEGKFLGSFGRMGYGKGEFLFPWDVAVSPNGDRIAVTDTDNGRIQVFDQNGLFIALCNSPGLTIPGLLNHFASLRGITFDPTGENIYCADAVHNKIFMLSADLKIKKCIQLYPEGLLKYPQGLAVDKVGNILVCDSGRNCVRVVTKNGTLLSTRGGLGCNGIEDGPLGIVVMNDGSVVVVNKNEQLSVF